VLFGGGEELGLGFLVEDVVDDLDGVEPAVSHQVDQRVLILLGRADADAADFAFLLEFPQVFEGGRILVPSPRPGVEL
jgi:hypothetical protein